MTAPAFDVVIVGAGPAGLGAALVLGRMRRRVLVLDTDAPAHAVADAVHGFLSRDGTPPRELRRIGREQLEVYGTVELRQAAARAARQGAGGAFELELDTGARVTGTHLLLAHGMRYGLPDVPGVAQFWGTHVFHCPYCHGFEVHDRPLAVYGHGDRAVHQAVLLTSVSDDVALIPAGSTLGVDQCRLLADAGVDLRGDDVRRVEPHGAGLRLVLRDGPAIDRDALFIQPALSLASDLAASLGARHTDTGAIAVDATGATTVPGLYAAGDAATAVQSVAVASGSGARAAYAINADLAIARAARRAA